MKKIHRIIVLLLWVTFVLTPQVGWAEDIRESDDAAYRVFVLFSYSPDFPTTDSFLAGLDRGFEGTDITMHVEFMDTKRIFDETHLKNFEQMLDYKLENREPYDLLIVTDDNALRFMVDCQQLLFGDIPILFMGINSDDLAYARDHCKDITGIIERPSMTAQLQVIESLFPRMDELVVLRDQTPTGLAEYEEFQRAISAFPQMEIRELDSTAFSFQEFEEQLETIHGNDVIFLLSSYLDREGGRRDFEEVMALLRRQVAPVLTPYEFGVGQGALGGKLVNYAAYGEETARRAVRILQGEPIGNFPVLDGESANRYQFDYQQMERFLIEKDQLPEGSEVLFEPQPFYQVYRELFLFLLGLAILAVVSIVFLSILLRMRTKSAEVLREKNLRFLSFFSAVEFPVVILDADDRIVQSNRRFMKMFHLEGIRGKPKLKQVIGSWSEVNPDEYVLIDDPFIQAKVNLIIDGEQKLGAYVLFSDESHERLLQQNLSVYKKILQANRESVMVANHEMQLVWANQSFLDLVQRPLSRLKGVSIRLALDPLTGSQAIWPDLETEGFWAGELTFENEDDSRVFFFKIFAVYEGDMLLNYVGILEEITAKKQQERLLVEMAQKDRLTGLMNRTLFFEIAEERLKKSQSARLVMLNLNHMKLVNDRFGHYFGDEVVRQVANRLKTSFSEAVISRLGGDEFTLCFYDLTDEAWNAILIQLKEMFGKPFRIGEEELEVTASIGTSRYPKDASGVPELVTCADLAMSAGRRDQKNYILAYRDEMKARAHDSYELMASMKHGIESDEFYLEYQPIIHGDQKRIVAVEALIRWKHPKLGRISPMRFIPIAESMGYIHPIGQWVLKQAVEDLKQLPEDILMHVNVSVSQLYEPTFFRDVHRILKESGVAPERMVLEFTETLPFSDGTQIEDFLRDARQAGVQIAIDDFGQGYANLAQLKKVPADILKVDQVFVRQIDQNQENKEILQSILVLSKKFGCQLVAEGVEQEAEAKFLSEMECLLQGYYIARPMGLQALLNMIEKMQREED